MRRISTRWGHGVRAGFRVGVLLLAAELGVVLAAFAARRGPAASNEEGPRPQGI